MVRPAEASAPAVSRETLQRFQSTIVPHLDSAYNFARYLSRDPDAASDIVQDAFLRAYRSFEGFRGGDARAWMFAIIRNCHRAWHNEGRQKARYEVSMSADSDDGAEHPVNRIAAETDTPEASTMRQSESARVRRVIAGLSEPMREVLVLRELEDFSYKQISEVLDIPVGTVMSRLARARAEFGEAWRALEAGEASR
jgi:RNA polymerase sigma-70 factor (ECF subfamily)